MPEPRVRTTVVMVALSLRVPASAIVKTRDAAPRYRAIWVRWRHPLVGFSLNHDGTGWTCTILGSHRSLEEWAALDAQELEHAADHRSFVSYDELQELLEELWPLVEVEPHQDIGPDVEPVELTEAEEAELERLARVLGLRDDEKDEEGDDD